VENAKILPIFVAGTPPVASASHLTRNKPVNSRLAADHKDLPDKTSGDLPPALAHALSDSDLRRVAAA
jgi:hypothetical protein